MSTTTTVAGAGGAIAGGWLGRAIGALAGAIAGPGGAAVGGWIGGRVGAVAGRAAAEALASYLEDANENVESKTKPIADTDDCATGNCKPKDPCEHLRRGQGSGKYRGGAHKEMAKPRGDKLDSHHMPAKDSFPKSDFNDLPAIQMEELDHRKTMSNGNKGADGARWRAKQGELIRDGKYKEALQMDIDDARRIAKEAGDPTRYDEAIKEAEEYAACREKHGLNKPKEVDTPVDVPIPDPIPPESGTSPSDTPVS